jgi:hypothetical protein
LVVASLRIANLNARYQFLREHEHARALIEQAATVRKAAWAIYYQETGETPGAPTPRAKRAPKTSGQHE